MVGGPSGSLILFQPQEVHNKNRLHGNIIEFNVLLTEDLSRHAVIADFGLAINLQRRPRKKRK